MIILLLAIAVVYLLCRNKSAEIEQLLGGELSATALEEKLERSVTLPASAIAKERSQRNSRQRNSRSSESRCETKEETTPKKATTPTKETTPGGKEDTVLFAGMQVRAKIFLSLIQVLIQIGPVFEIVFPPVFSSVLNWTGILQLDLFSLMPLPCLFESDFHKTLLLRTLVPLAVMAAIGIWGGCLLSNSGVSTRSGASRVWLGNLLLNLVFLILFAVYASVSRHIFATFSCISLDDGTSWLRADLSIDCSSSQHTTMVGYAAVMIFVYPLGAPALYAYLLFGKYGATFRRLAAIDAKCTNLSKLASSEHEYARLMPRSTSSLAAWRKEVEPQIEELEAEKLAVKRVLPDFIQTLSGNGYAPFVFYFEIIECLRKLSIVCVPVFFSAGSNGQLLFGLIICFLSYGVYSALRPYSRAEDNDYANLAQALIFFSVLSAITLSTAFPGDTTTKAMDVALTALFFTPLLFEILIQTGCIRTGSTSTSSSPQDAGYFTGARCKDSAGAAETARRRGGATAPPRATGSSSTSSSPQDAGYFTGARCRDSAGAAETARPRRRYRHRVPAQRDGIKEMPAKGSVGAPAPTAPEVVQAV